MGDNLRIKNGSASRTGRTMAAKRKARMKKILDESTPPKNPHYQPGKRQVKKTTRKKTKRG